MIERGIKEHFFSIPYAGGSAMSLAHITSRLRTEDLEIHRLELPGRGARHLEPLYENVLEMVDDLYGQVTSKIGIDEGVFIWGYSMGAILALLLAEKLLLGGYRILGMMVSAMKAPKERSQSAASLSNLSAADFAGIIERMQPQRYRERRQTAIFQNATKKQERILKADLQALDSFSLKDWQDIQINAPIMVLRSTQDELMPDGSAYNDWSLHSSAVTSFYILKGGHFAVFEFPDETIAILKNAIRECRRQPAASE